MSIDNPILKFTIVYVFNIAILSLTVVKVNDKSKNEKKIYTCIMIKMNI
jgi:hypothetical protein